MIVSGDSFSGEIQLNGTVVWLVTGRLGQPWNFSSTLNPSDFSSNPLRYPSSAKDNFSSSATHLGAADCDKPYGATVSITATNAQAYTNNGKAYAPGSLLLGTTSTSASSTPTNNMFPMAVELPLFNATSLGVTVHCPPSTAPCQLPLEGFYNFVLVVAIILAGIGFLVQLVNGSLGGKGDGGYAKPLLNTFLAIFFIILFPLIYNNVAAVINYLDMAIIAGPGNPYTAYSGNIQFLWDKLMTLTGGTLWGMFTSTILTVAAWIVGLIVWILVFILGIIRVLLVAVMVITFPISLALKEVPFTKKLASMVEDTLFGLMLASLMSAIVLGVAAYVLRQGTAGTILNGGGDNFVAAMALLLALLMPTVLAPLTGTLFQTASQAGMVAVGTAALMTAAGGMGVGGGVTAGMSPAALGQSASLARALGYSLSDPVQAQQFAAHVGTMSRGERLAAAIQHRTMLSGLAGAAPAMVLSVGSVGLQGALVGMGSVQAGRDIGRL
ncbi:MAG: hypothetical protein HYW93_01660, partial [Thaumarchaeota archaeon]|nr:hypothetical protein [Nitrososphaerota archaeon]